MFLGLEVRVITVKFSRGDPTVFQNNLEAFQTFWEKKEPEFISYFKDYYANRVGEYTKVNYALHCK